MASSSSCIGSTRKEACKACDSDQSSLATLPDCVLQQHLLPRLTGLDKKIFRLTCPRQRQLINQCVSKVCVPANALQTCPARTKLGNAFPAARTLQAFDWEDASIDDEQLIRFLSGSAPWLAGLREVDLKRCHHVTPRLLAFLRTSCHSLKKLAPSRWTDAGGLADIAQFKGLEELDLGDSESDIITVEDLGLNHLLGLAGSLKSLSLSRCRWISDAAASMITQLAKLEVLDLSHTDVGPKALAQLVQLPLLHTIILSGCRNVTDEALQQLAGLPSLASVTLRGSAATNAGLKHLVVLPRLAHLDLGSKWELDDAGLAAVAACPSLKLLAAGSFNLVQPNLGANPRGLQKLEHLSFGGGFANKGLHLLFPLLNLKSLHVQGIDSVTDCVMRYISASQKQLQHLALRSGYSLTFTGLQLLASLANLAVLSVGACPAISRSSLEGFTAQHARLTRLLVGACPLLADSQDALCALAQEPAVAVAWAPCVRVN